MSSPNNSQTFVSIHCLLRMKLLSLWYKLLKNATMWGLKIEFLTVNYRKLCVLKNSSKIRTQILANWNLQLENLVGFQDLKKSLKLVSMMSERVGFIYLKNQRKLMSLVNLKSSLTWSTLWCKILYWIFAKTQ